MRLPIPAAHTDEFLEHGGSILLDHWADLSGSPGIRRLDKAVKESRVRGAANDVVSKNRHYFVRKR
jgi:hypothetical protein